MGRPFLIGESADEGQGSGKSSLRCRVENYHFLKLTTDEGVVG
jgi:hypothetical protein